VKKGKYCEYKKIKIYIHINMDKYIMTLNNTTLYVVVSRDKH
jgi:hypothetical protein